MIDKMGARQSKFFSFFKFKPNFLIFNRILDILFVQKLMRNLYSNEI